MYNHVHRARALSLSLRAL